MSEEEAVVTIAAMVILSGAGLMYAAMVNRRRVREMEHRERLAMIERGIAPPAEHPSGEIGSLARPAPAGASRFRTAGVCLIGIGIGLFFVIGFAGGAPSAGLGVGGAWAVLGAALLVNYHLLSQREEDTHMSASARWTPPPARTPADPPDNIAP